MSYNNTTAGSGISIAYNGGYQTISCTGGGGGSPTSFSPVLSFGGSSTGITYITQSGTYQQLTANLIYFTGIIELSSKGSATGTARVSLPNTASGVYPPSLLTIDCINLFAALSIGQFLVLQTTSSSANATIAVGNGSTSSALSDTNFTNSSAIYYTGSFFI